MFFSLSINKCGCSQGVRDLRKMDGTLGRNQLSIPPNTTAEKMDISKIVFRVRRVIDIQLSWQKIYCGNIKSEPAA